MMVADEVKNAVLEYFRFKRQCPYIATECFDGDVVVSDGKLVTEVEIKVSYGDFVREFKKRKYQRTMIGFTPTHEPNLLYFAAPVELAHKILSDPRHRQYGHGIIAVEKYMTDFYDQRKGRYEKEVYAVEILERAKKQHDRYVSETVLQTIVARMASEVITMRKLYRNGNK